MVLSTLVEEVQWITARRLIVMSPLSFPSFGCGLAVPKAVRGLKGSLVGQSSFAIPQPFRPVRDTYFGRVDNTSPVPSQSASKDIPYLYAVRHGRSSHILRVNIIIALRATTGLSVTKPKPFNRLYC